MLLIRSICLTFLLLGNIYLLWAQTPFVTPEPALVKDIVTGKGSTTFDNFASAAGLLFFTADDGIHGNELWRSDGTEQGTFMLKDMVSGKGAPAFVYDINSFTTSKQLFFITGDKDPLELWRSDGTANGTIKLSTIKNLANGFYSVFSTRPALLNGIIYYNSDDGSHGEELWRSDGTSAGTYMLKDIEPSESVNGVLKNYGSRPTNLVTLNGTLFFGASISVKSNGTSGTQSYLWRSDGTTNGTTIVQKAAPTNMYNGGRLLYFTELKTNPASATSATASLWRSDGTAAGTFLVDSVNSGIVTAGNGYFPIAADSNLFYFSIAQRDVSTRKLWRSNGTKEGTFTVVDSINSRNGYTIYKNYLYFGKTGGLWRTDGTRQGTSLFKAGGVNYTPLEVNGTFFFNLNGQLWRTNGSQPSTVMVRNVSPQNLISVQDTLYFTVEASAGRLELWRSDGSSQGTILIKRFQPEQYYVPNYRQLADVDGTLFFEANEGAYGNELWRLGTVRKTLTYQHVHQSPQNPTFYNEKLLSKNPPFRVCADGSNVSIFEVHGGNHDYKKFTFRIKEFSFPLDTLQGGKFTVLKSTTSDELIVRYRHPSHVQTSADTRTLTLELVEQIGPVNRIVDSIPLQVYRAPVLMVHGLWSNPSSFTAMKSSLTNSKLYPSNIELLAVANYEDTHARPFVTNIPVIKKNVEDLLASVLSKGVATGNVDYVAHSMGGILGRLYLQGDQYKSGFHKIITLNTPHSGSQVANFILKHGFTTWACEFFIPKKVTGGRTDACIAGAVDDLQVNSLAINQALNGSIYLNRRVVPSHSIATTYKGQDFSNPSAADSFEKRAKDFVAMFITDSEALFEGENDLIVSKASQLANVGPCTTVIPNQMHPGSPENRTVIARVTELLIENPNSPYFCNGFYPPNLTYNNLLRVSDPKASRQVAASIKIEQPGKGTKIGADKDIKIIVTSSERSEIRTVIDYNSDSVYVAKNTATQAIINVKAYGKFDGKKQIITIGKIASQPVAVDTSHFYIVQSAPVALPEAPINLRISSSISTNVTLIWKDVATNETGYEVERSSGNSSFIKIADLSQNSQTFTEQNLAPATSYQFRVRATNSAGSSPYSNIVTFTPLILPVEPEPIIQLYPNPLTHPLQLSIAMKGLFISSCRVSNLLGQTITTWSGLKTGMLTVSLPDLPVGMYFVDLQTSNGRQARQKFIIN